MQQHWVKKSDSKSLILFILGWACDYRCVEHLDTHGYDSYAIYDYGDGFQELDRSLFTQYDDITLVAWSFGVYVAEQITKKITLSKAIAFNGTPYPVHSTMGIEPKRVSITIRGLAKRGCTEFLKRTYGDAYPKMQEIAEPRTTAQNVRELELLSVESQREYTPHISWDLAIIGDKDLIFPPENMITYWGLKGQVVPLPHYPFEDPKCIEVLLAERGR